MIHKVSISKWPRTSLCSPFTVFVVTVIQLYAATAKRFRAANIFNSSFVVHSKCLRNSMMWLMMRYNIHGDVWMCFVCVCTTDCTRAFWTRKNATKNVNEMSKGNGNRDVTYYYYYYYWQNRISATDVDAKIICHKNFVAAASFRFFFGALFLTGCISKRKRRQRRLIFHFKRMKRFNQ